MHLRLLQYRDDLVMNTKPSASCTQGTGEAVKILLLLGTCKNFFRISCIEIDSKLAGIYSKIGSGRAGHSVGVHVPRVTRQPSRTRF